MTDEEKALIEGARQGPGGFTNISRYLDVNKDQGAAMAGALEDDVRSTAEGVKTDLDNTQKAFNQGQETYQKTAGSGMAPGQVRPYTGSKSLGQMNEGLGAAATSAGKNAKALGSQQGLVGQAGRVFGKGAANYGRQAQGMDAFLAGAAAPQSLGDVASEFGGLETMFETQNENSIQTAAGAEGKAKGVADEKKRIGDREAKALSDKEAAAQAERDSRLLGEGAGKAESWDDYTGGNRFENTLDDVLGNTFLNPASAIQEGTGNRSWQRSAHAGMDKWANDNLGTKLNSNKFNWGPTGVLGMGMDDSIRKSVYDSLSGEELAQLENMSHMQADQYVVNRLRNLGDKARVVLDSTHVDPNVTNPAQKMALQVQALVTEYGFTNEQAMHYVKIANEAKTFNYADTR
jgi:hypothetical protein